MSQNVLITRPEPGATETAMLLEARGHKFVISPFMNIIPLTTILPMGITSCIVTSSNAVWALPPGVRTFTVGDATARRAQQKTLAPVTSAGGDGKALTQLVRSSLAPDEGTLLLLTGQNLGACLAHELRASGFKVVRRVVYRTHNPRRFPSPARQAIEQLKINSVLFFSAATAKAFAKLCPINLYSSLSKIRALTLSPAISDSLRSMPWQSIQAAETPSQEALFKLL